MFARLFRQDRPTAFLILPVVVAVLWPGAAPHAADLFAGIPTGMPLFAPVRRLLTAAVWAPWVVGGLLVIGLAFQVSFLAKGRELYDRRNDLPALLLPLVLALLPQGLVPDPAFMGMFFVLWALSRIWSCQGRSQAFAPLFDAGLLLGIASLFYLPYAFLVVVAWASLAVMRPFEWREYVLPLLGIALILFLAWGGWHVFASRRWDPLGSMRAEQAGHWAWGAGHWMYRVILGSVLLCWVVAGTWSFTGVYARSIMKEKNIRASFLAFVFALALVAGFAWMLSGTVPAVLIAVPVSVLFGYPVLQARRTGWSEAGLWCLLGLGLWARWMG